MSDLGWITTWNVLGLGMQCSGSSHVWMGVGLHPEPGARCLCGVRTWAPAQEPSA